MNRRRIAIWSLALAIVGGGPAAARAQETASIEGMVRAANTGEPIGGATVRIVEIERRTTTDAAGRFSLRNVPEGSYTLEIAALSWVSERRTVIAGGRWAGGPGEVAVALAPEVIEAPRIDVVLDRFRVVGGPDQRLTIPGSAHVIGPEELVDQKLLYDDVNRILRQVPGINIQEEEGYGLRPNIGIRGTGSERSSKITLMEDGVLIAPAPYAAPSAYYFPLAGRMEAIEIRKGSSQIKYGPHTIGGAINFVSSPIPEELSWTLEAEGGEDASGKLRARIGDSSENFGWLAETYQIRTDGFKRLDGGGDTGFEIGDYLLKVRVNTDRDADVHQALELKLGYYDQTSDETYLGLTEADFRDDPFRRYAASQEDVLRADHTQIQLGHRIQPSPSVDVSTVLYRNDFGRNWYKLGSVGGEEIEDILDDPEAFPELVATIRGATSGSDALTVVAGKREYYGQGVQSIVDFQTGRRVPQEIELSVRYHADQEDRFQHADGFQMVDGEMLLTERGAPGSESNRVSDARAWSFFAEDRMSLGRWTVTPGVRYEAIDFTRTDYALDDPGRRAPTRVRESDVNAWIPGVGASYEAAAGLHLFGGIHKGFGPPGPSADDETEPEGSVNYELGARLERPALEAEAVAFYSDYRNILGRGSLASGDPVGAGDLFNGGEVDVRGIELSLDYDPAGSLGMTFGLPMRLAYTFTRAEFETSFESEFEPWGRVEAGDELPYVPPHQLSASLGFESGPWELRLSANHVAEMRTRAGRGPIPAGEGTDAFTVLDASGQFELASGRAVFVGVRNLADDAYVVARQPAGARPGLPRTLLAGIRLAR